MSTVEIDSPEIQWYGLQTMLEQAKSDTLILLDCCAAASSATGSGNGITEIIAACGFEAWAPDVGEHSFTRSLIDELRYLSRTGPFSTSMLHNKVLSRVKYWKPRYAPSASHREIEMRRAPIYIVVSNEKRPRSIELEPLQRFRSPAADSNISQSSSPRGSAFSSLSISEDHASISEATPGSSSSSIGDVWPDKDFDCPKVLISVNLEKDQLHSSRHWADWIRSIPAFVKYANVEGVYKSNSTLLLISISIAVWNLVPPSAAISFVGFLNSRDLLQVSSIQAGGIAQGQGLSPKQGHRTKGSIVIEDASAVLLECIETLEDPQAILYMEAFIEKTLVWIGSFGYVDTVSSRFLHETGPLMPKHG